MTTAIAPEITDDTRTSSESFRLHLLTSGHTEKTANTYCWALDQFRRWTLAKGLSLSTLARDYIRVYIVEMLHRVSPNTAIRTLAVLRAFYNYLDDNDDRTHGIHVKKERLAPRVPLNDAEFRQLLTGCRSARDRLMITVAHSLGLRLGELIGLQSKDVNLGRSLILVHGKGQKQRWLPLGADLCLALKPYLGSGPLWRLANGEPMTTVRAKRMLEQVSQRAGIHVHWHRLRTTFANDALGAGMLLEDLQVLMGHADIGVTAHYAGYAISQRAMSQMERLMFTAAANHVTGGHSL